MGIFDLEKHYVFYASYHDDERNKYIHIACVWPILWTTLVFAQYAPYSTDLEFLEAWIPIFNPINLATLVTVFYAVAYVIMEPKAGAIAGCLLLLMLCSSRSFFLVGAAFGYEPWQIAAVIHVACWTAQFFGHAKFEGRAPALFDNLFQAFMMAPLFVLLEVLFKLGYRKDFQKQIIVKVEAEIAKFKACKASKKN